MKKILILGANGDIGKYLVEYLSTQVSEKFEIIASGRRKAAFSEYENVKYTRTDNTK